MDVKICRVCLETSEPMANIFECIPDRRISIADMISQCTGFLVSKDDSFPKTICSPCKQDATNAYEIKQLYETSHQVFCQIGKELKEEQDLIKEEICEKSNYEGTGTRQAQYEGETKEIGQDLVVKDEFQGQVKNEPVEEDIFDEDPLHISDFYVDFEVKSEELKDYFQADGPNYVDTEETAESVQKHIRTHTGERRYKCSHCKMSFSENRTFQDHIRVHTGERPYKCSHCQKTFAKNFTLQIHIRAHQVKNKPVEDPLHISDYYVDFEVKRQELKDYFQADGPNYVDTGETAENVQKHFRTHTEERPYKCSPCNKSYSYKTNLQRHMRTHAGERPFKCSHCQKSFSQKITLQEHILTHTGERPHKCSHCKKSFSRKRHLVLHIRTHTGERPYNCSQCQKSFSRMSSLKRHLPLHRKERKH